MNNNSNRLCGLSRIKIGWEIQKLAVSVFSLQVLHCKYILCQRLAQFHISTSSLMVEQGSWENFVLHRIFPAAENNSWERK